MPLGDTLQSRLGLQAEWHRQGCPMGVVGIGYTVAAALPGPPLMRVAPGVIGICFLCWPNLAYHLTNVFIEGPTTEGRVGSAASDGSHSVISFQL